MNAFENLIRVASVEKKNGVASLTVKVNSDHLNDSGTLHGGFIASLLDAVSGHAGMSSLPPNYSLVALQIDVSFIRAASAGELRADARVVKPGMQILHIASELSDPQGALLARGQGIWMIQRVLARTPG